MSARIAASCALSDFCQYSTILTLATSSSTSRLASSRSSPAFAFRASCAAPQAATASAPQTPGSRLAPDATTFRKAARSAAAASSAADGLSRSVAPESMFLLDKNGNSEARDKAEASARAHSIYEKEFHLFKGVLLGAQNDAHWQEIFEEAAQRQAEVDIEEVELALHPF